MSVNTSSAGVNFIKRKNSNVEEVQETLKLVSEEELLAKGSVSPQDVLSLQSITRSILWTYIKHYCALYVYKNFNEWFNIIFSDYLCSPDSNVYDIGRDNKLYYNCNVLYCNFSTDFTRFCIRDMETGMTLFEIAKPLPSGKTTSPHRKFHFIVNNY